MIEAVATTNRILKKPIRHSAEALHLFHMFNKFIVLYAEINRYYNIYYLLIAVVVDSTSTSSLLELATKPSVLVGITRCLTKMSAAFSLWAFSMTSAKRRPIHWYHYAVTWNDTYHQKWMQNLAHIVKINTRQEDKSRLQTLSSPCSSIPSSRYFDTLL